MPTPAAPRVSTQARKVLRANPSVVGFSERLKPKIVRGKPTRRHVIRVYVEKKLPKKAVPKNLFIPSKIGGVATDVVAIGVLEPTQVANRQKFRPLLGGCSGTWTGGGDGTLGYFMRDKRQPPPPNKPQWYALSCAHVLHPGGIQNETIQPSPNDGGIAPQDWVGRENFFTYDGVDAALSRIDVGAKAEIIGLPTPVRTAKPSVGMTVAKSGRTTGVTYGAIIDDGVELNFPRWGTAPGRVRFSDVIIVANKHRHFSDPGDSGSLVIDPADDTVIGMVFGGDPTLTPKTTIVAPIARILRAFPLQMLVRPGETYP